MRVIHLEELQGGSRAGRRDGVIRRAPLRGEVFPAAMSTQHLRMSPTAEVNTSNRGRTMHSPVISECHDPGRGVVASQRARVKWRGHGAGTAAADEDVARSRKVRVDPSEHGHGVHLAPMMDEDRARSSGVAVEHVGCVAISEMDVAGAVRDYHDRPVGKGVLRVRHIENPTQFLVDSGPCWREVGLICPPTFALLTSPAAASTLEIHEQLVGGSPSREEMVGGTLCAGRFSARSKLVPAVFQFAQRRECNGLFRRVTLCAGMRRERCVKEQRDR